MKKRTSVLLSVLMTMMLAACSHNDAAVSGSETTSVGAEAMGSVTDTEASENNGTGITFIPGSYEGSAAGNNGELTVEVTVTENAIESIIVKEHQETPGLADPALTQIPQNIVKYQSLGVDTISGATVTSKALIEATATALEQSGADVSLLREVPVNREAVTQAEDRTTQIVVAGGGMSGLMAALTAANQGTEVILIEKLGTLGGSTNVAAGGLATVESDLIPDDMDDSLERIMARTRLMNETSVRQPDYDFLAAILAQTGTTVDYISSEYGITPEFEDRGDYIRSRYGSGSKLINGLAKELDERGGTVLLNTRADEIVMDGETAIGLKVTGDGGAYTIYADKIIIATGGASWDQERMLEMNPELRTIPFVEAASVGNTGDGFTMLENIGAKMGEGPFVKPSLIGFSLTSHSLSISNVMLFDAEGNRFANEAPLFSTMITTYLLRQASPAYYVLFDESQVDAELLADLQENAVGDNPQKVVYGETIEELAEKLQIPAETLRATFNRYQELCINGVDTDFLKDASHLIPYTEDSGFYAAHVHAGSFGTFGGAITDEQFRVLRENDTVIDNVFAVGECATSEFFGEYYQGAFSLGLYATAGRIAAETAVSEINGVQ